MIRQAPTEVKSRVVLMVVGLGTALSLIGDSSLYTVLPTHTAEAAITIGALGVMLSANRWVRLASNGPVGWLCDRWPRRWIFVPALFLGALSTAVYGFTQGYWPLLVGRLLWGISWSGIWVSGNAIVLDVATGQNRGRLIGLYNVAFFTGAGAGSFVGGWFTDLWGYATAMRLAAGLTLLGAVVVWLVLPETKMLRQKQTARDAVQDPPTAVSPREMGSVLALIGLNRLLMAGTLFPTFGLFLEGILGDGVSLGEQWVGVTTLTGLGLSMSTFVGMAAVPLAGSMSDRWGNRWRATSVGLLPGTLGFIMLAGAGPWAIALGLPLTSATSGSNQGMATTLVGDVAGKQSGRYLGILFTVGDLASAAGPLLVFWLVRSIDLRTIYLVAGGLFGLMFLIAGYWSLRR